MKLRLLFHLQICISHRRLYPINDVPGNPCFTSHAEGCTKGLLPVGFRCRSVLNCAERLRSEDSLLETQLSQSWVGWDFTRIWIRSSTKLTQELFFVTQECFWTWPSWWKSDKSYRFWNLVLTLRYMFCELYCWALQMPAEVPESFLRRLRCMYLD